MFFNYIKIAFRSLVKFKGYAAINLLGLALGLTAGILIMVYVLDEFTFDNLHGKRDRIYRVETQLVDAKNPAEQENVWDANAWPVGNVLQKDYPEVESVLYTRSASFLLISHEGKKIRERIHFASPEFFQLFSFRMLKGNADKALDQPYSIVISEDMERKYFKGEDALSKNLTLGDSLQFTVTGVIENIPGYSHLQLDMLVSFSTYTALDKSFSYDEG